MLHHEERPRFGRRPASSTLETHGWSIMASAWRSASKRAMTCFVHAGLDHLEATSRRIGSACSAGRRFHPSFSQQTDQAIGSDAPKVRPDPPATPRSRVIGVRATAVTFGPKKDDVSSRQAPRGSPHGRSHRSASSMSRSAASASCSVRSVVSHLASSPAHLSARSR
jgi:hypothetical protein